MDIPKTKHIELGKGYYTLVSAKDYDRLVKNKWRASFYRNTKNSPLVARVSRVVNENGKRKWIYMHREIVRPPKGMQVDHINGSPLDNRRENLRVVTNQQNQFNSKLYTNNTSGFKGVTWDKSRSRWLSRIRINGNRVHLGYYDNLIEAHMAYKEAAKKYFGAYIKH